MKLLSLVFALLLTSTLLAQDTFSIVAADPETGEIGAAGATCVDGIAGFGGVQLINQIIPGRGAVNGQAYICIPHVNLNLAMDKMAEGLSPEEIIDFLVENDACSAQNFNPEFRQYGIVDFDAEGNVRTAGFTGNSADDYKEDRTGPTYAIQGNILLGPEVIDGMEDGFNNTEGSLAQKLMAAMQGANFAGADARCLDRGTSSTSAFLRVARPTDDANELYLDLNVVEMPFGQEPIDSLQSLFDAWELVNATRNLAEAERVNLFPNPTQGQVTLQATDNAIIHQVTVYSLFGQRLREITGDSSQRLTLDLNGYPTGTYYLKIGFRDGGVVMRRVVVDR